MPDKRFKKPDEKKQYSIQKVWDHHREITRLLVASNGRYKNKEIAQMVGCCEQTVSNVRNDPMVRDILSRLHDRADDQAIDVAAEVRNMFPLASKVLSNVMRLCEDPTITEMQDPRIISQSTRAAIAALDHSHPKKVEGTITHGHVTLEQIQEMKRRINAKQVETEVLED